MGKVRPKISVFEVIRQPLELRIHTDAGLIKAENNVLKYPKQLLNNFEKLKKTTFLTPEIVKNDPQ